MAWPHVGKADQTGLKLVAARRPGSNPGGAINGYEDIVNQDSHRKNTFVL